MDGVPARWLDRSGQPLGGEDQPGQLVVLAHVGRDERAPPDVVEVSGKADVTPLGTDVATRRDQGLGDAPNEHAVRTEPIRVGVPVKEVPSFCGYLRQLAIDTSSHHD